MLRSSNSFFFQIGLVEIAWTLERLKFMLACSVVSPTEFFQARRKTRYSVNETSSAILLQFTIQWCFRSTIVIHYSKEEGQVLGDARRFLASAKTRGGGTLSLRGFAALGSLRSREAAFHQESTRIRCYSTIPLRHHIKSGEPGAVVNSRSVGV